VFVRKKTHVFAELGPQTANPQITKKIGAPNCKSPECHICGRFANLSNWL